MNHLQVIILSGGKSSRMGSDKGLMPYDDVTFIEKVITAAASITSKIIIVSNSKAYQRFGFEVFPDLIQNCGPAGGIYTGLVKSNQDINLILSNDIPMMSLELLNFLVSEYKNEEVLILKEGSQIHPLVGIYHKNCAEVFKNQINQGNFKMLDILSQLNTGYIEVPLEFQPMIRNINTREEYNRLQNE